MAGQGVDRRQALKLMAMGAAAAQFAGFERWVYAHEHQIQSPHAAPKNTKPYKPLFFSKHEYLTLVSLADILIPADDTPGALEAGAPEFIDFIISHDEPQQPGFRQGFKWLDRRSQKLHTKDFVKLSKEQQNALIESISDPAKVKKSDEEGHEFFKLARNYTVMGYYTSKVGMQALGVPTLQSYSEAPACPHHDDPLHKNLGTT